MATRQEYKYNPQDFEPNVAIGVVLPLTTDRSLNSTHPASGSMKHGVNAIGSRFEGGEFNQSYTSKDQAKSNLKNLILTNQGERVYHPDFGCGIYSALFENATEKMISDLKSRINEQIKIWLPYIRTERVEIFVDEFNENKIVIQLDYYLFENIHDPQSIVLEF